MSPGDPNRRRALERMLDNLTDQEGEEDFSLRTSYPYLLGVYLAINAVSDAYLLVEGPDCTYMKSQYIQGNHDWMSTLTSVSGFHRVANTALHPSMMTESRERPLRDMLLRMAAHPSTGGLVLTSMPMAFITGADYERLCREVSLEAGKEVLFVPGLSLSGDWLDGYARTLDSLASQLDLSGGKPEPKRVAVVGLLHDRNEADCAANVQVLEQMCAVAGLELVSVWLSGQRFGQLGAIRDAGTILSLPYGRKAARKIARQTGAEVHELALPFGPAASIAFMEQLGQLGGSADRVRDWLGAQLAEITPRMEWLVPYLFQNLRVGYAGDPHLLPGLRDIVEELGGRLACAAVTNRPVHAKALELDAQTELLVYPRLRAFCRFIGANALEGELDLLVTNNYGVTFPLPDTAVVEFGFPSIFRHALFDRPSLGLPGWLAFVDTLANALRQRELERARSGLVT